MSGEPEAASEAINPARKRSRGGAAMVVGMLAIAAGAGLWLYRSVGWDGSQSARMGDLARPGAAAGYNVLLITFDTTRRDRIGCYGYRGAHTPNIDGLAARGVRFDDAVVAAPLTGPSHATILTGLNPPRHGMRTNGLFALAAENETLAERMAGQGYETAAFVSTFVLEKRYGLDQGFSFYDFEVSEAGRQGPESVFNEREADRVTDAALAWLKGRGASGAKRPFFAWVHYYDPHHPFRAPRLIDPSLSGRAYDAEIAFADAEMGRLLAWLDETGQRDRTLILFATDHGEMLDEHGEDHHGIFVYESVIRGGLIFSCPSLFDRAYRDDERVVGMVDVMPTVLELTVKGAEASRGLKFDGISLLSESSEADRAIYIESEYPKMGLGCAPYYGLRTHGAKFISAPRPEYFDLEDDRGEMENLYRERPDGLAALESRLAELMKQHPDRFVSAERRMSAEETSRLAALGYVGGAAPEGEDDELPDAKDVLHVFKRMNEVIALAKKGKNAEAIKLAKEIAEECGGYESPIHTIASIYEATGRAADAADILETYAKKRPTANVLVHLGKVYLKLRNREGFERVLGEAERLEPLRGSIQVLRGDWEMNDGKIAEAVRFYEKAFEIDGERMGAEERGRLERARKKLGDGLEKSKTGRPGRGD